MGDSAIVMFAVEEPTAPKESVTISRKVIAVPAGRVVRYAQSNVGVTTEY